MALMESTKIIIDRAMFEHLMIQVRKAQGKLYQVKGGRELASEIDWIMKMIDKTAYLNADKELDQLMDELGLTYVEGLDEPLPIELVNFGD